MKPKKNHDALYAVIAILLTTIICFSFVYKMRQMYIQYEEQYEEYDLDYDDDYIESTKIEEQYI